MTAIMERLEKDDCSLIMNNCVKKKMKKGETVFKEGSTADYLYFIQSGEIRIFKNIGPGKELNIFTRRENDAFGELGIFGGDRYSNTAIASTFTSVFCVGREKMEQIISQNGRIGLHFTRWVAESLEESKAKMRDYLAFGSEGAVASVFIRYSNMYGIVTPEGIRIKRQIQLSDVGKHIGISRETVSRIVNKWKEEGIMTSENKFFLIMQPDHLRNLLGCEYCVVENCIL
ncbi:Crp/Fnr family transcriptional regulator [Virgibacillus sp. 179-BFC.A HS]|uniref:Crp/Fnr family transcriptional regulator n=1 Tax=Tigheibacillus jepli TaxID=3035914 RepID=A0ABU5CJ43_9BACI|nr:Crp/Fnr family transcriptional regulator [Virgibacillus sp. 179-BFC.A HS]MDY0406344.1 Crp/Fnr family transcriptional regulator [Virgibacillus sp. 179-BFC.A HS]